MGARETVAWLKFDEGVQEIFAIQVLPHRFPDVINDNRKLLADSFVLPDASLARVRLLHLQEVLSTETVHSPFMMAVDPVAGVAKYRTVFTPAHPEPSSR